MLLPHSAGKHYILAMHVFGLMTQATTLKQFDEVVVSATVLFSSPCSGENVDRHFQNIQVLLTAAPQPVADESAITAEDFEVCNPLEKLKITH